MKRLLVVALLAFGCGEGPLPAPKVLSISPNTAPASDVTSVTVQVDGVLPTSVSYDHSTASVQRDVKLEVGMLTIGSGQWVPGGRLTGVIPSLLAPGSYDVRVSFADGRAGTLPNGFSVTPGNWPSGYTVDPIATQTAGVPFSITVHALGVNGATFNGTVNLGTSKGNVKPALSDPFTNGLLTQTVTIPEPISGLVLEVSDQQGTSGASNTFDVTR